MTVSKRGSGVVAVDGRTLTGWKGRDYSRQLVSCTACTVAAGRRGRPEKKVTQKNHNLNLKLEEVVGAMSQQA